MPCSFALRRSCADVDKNGTKDKNSWLATRRENLRKLRSQTRTVILMMALIEASKHDTIKMVLAGKHGYAPPGADDYGIAYNVGYFLSWLYLCLFMVLYMAVFSWWMPVTSSSDSSKSANDTTSDKSSFVTRLSIVLQQINNVLLPLSTGLCLVYYASILIKTLVYVDATPAVRTLPANNKKTWLIRLLLLTGIATSLGCGYFAFDILDTLDLAHVKTIEYWVMVVPVQINIGLVMATVMQKKVEQKIEKRRLLSLATSAAEEGRVEEKQALLGA